MPTAPRGILGALTATAALVVGTPVSGQQSARWEMIESGEWAMARVALPDTGSWPSQIELGCRKGMKPDEISLSVTFRIPRQTSGLPAEMTTMERRLGPQCRGRLTSFSAPSAPGKLAFRTAAASVATAVEIDIDFLQSQAPVSRRSEPPCEIAVHALDPVHARLTATATKDTRIVPLLELLQSSDAGEITIEVGGRQEPQRFPLTGAATTIAAARRFCGL